MEIVLQEFISQRQYSSTETINIEIRQINYNNSNLLIGNVKTNLMMLSISKQL